MPSDQPFGNSREDVAVAALAGLGVLRGLSFSDFDLKATADGSGRSGKLLLQAWADLICCHSPSVCME
jgi:hypothetical protein